MKKLLRIGIGFCLFFYTAFADDEVESVEIKHSLLPNMAHIYDMLPDEADSIDEMFSEGMFYGRLRFNSFGFRWDEEVENDDGLKLREDHYVAGVGGSIIFKSAVYNGVSATAGLYATQPVGSLDTEELYLFKPGKDLMNRYSALQGGSKGFTALAEAYIEYSYERISLKAGRQIFDSFLTNSNDTKMIPNTFEGVSATLDDMLGTYFKIGYLTKQKLRDHKVFHHVLAYGDNPDDPYAAYTQNDDSAMHRGLKLSLLEENGIEDRLIVVEAKNRMIPNMEIRANYTAVPDLISSAMVQASYHFELGEIAVIPGVRYMRQFDDGAGKIGGANLRMLTEGYTDPKSLDGSLFGARIDIVESSYKLRLGYTKVSDEGDIVAPWRGFPTGGFTRAMGQYNWYANTESLMAQFEYDYSGLTDIKVVSQFVRQDFDDQKAGVQADSDVLVLNLLKGFSYGGESNMYFKTRFAHVMGEHGVVTNSGFVKPDSSYEEIRFEVNYLF